jgi:hypothetical protein
MNDENCASPGTRWHRSIPGRWASAVGRTAAECDGSRAVLGHAKVQDRIVGLRHRVLVEVLAADLRSPDPALLAEVPRIALGLLGQRERRDTNSPLSANSSSEPQPPPISRTRSPGARRQLFSANSSFRSIAISSGSLRSSKMPGSTRGLAVEEAEGRSRYRSRNAARSTLRRSWSARRARGERARTTGGAGMAIRNAPRSLNSSSMSPSKSMAPCMYANAIRVSSIESIAATAS